MKKGMVEIIHPLSYLILFRKNDYFLFDQGIIG